MLQATSGLLRRNLEATAARISPLQTGRFGRRVRFSLR
jgi:hypothetical protein